MSPSARRSIVFFGTLVFACLVLSIALSGSVAADTACDETVSDDTELQNALDEAAEGETICVEEFDLGYEPVTVDTDGVSLVAAEDAEPFFNKSSGITVTAPDVTLDGLTITHTDQDALNVTDADGFVLRNTTLSNNDLPCCGPGPIGGDVAFAPRIESSDDVLVENNTIHGQDFGGGGVGLQYLNGTNATIKYNEFTENNNALTVSGSENISIHDNILRDNYRPSGITGPSLSVTESDSVTIDQNHLDNSTRSISLSAINESVVAENSFVDAGGTAVALSGETAASHNRIEGNTFVDGGQPITTEALNTTIRDNVVDGIGAGANATSGQTAGNVIRGTETLFENNTISDGSNYGLWVPGDEVTIRDNSIERVSNVGIRTRGDDIRIEQTTVTNIAEGAIDEDSIGLDLRGENLSVQQVTISGTNDSGIETSRIDGPVNLTIEDTTVSDTGVGLDVANATDMTVQNLSISDGDGAGITVGERATDVAIDSSTITDIGGPGIEAPEFSTLELTNSTITGVNGTGVIVATRFDSDDQGPLVSNNIIRYNSGGLVVKSPITGELDRTLATIENNAVQENHQFGLSVDGLLSTQAEVVLRNNSIQHNANTFRSPGTGIVYTAATGLDDRDVDARQNWWGTADGPASNATIPGFEVTDPETGAVADGEGNSITAEILFDSVLDGPEHDQPPRADASVETVFPEPGEELTFTDESIHPDGLDIVEREWDFGDGTTSDEEEPTVSFDDPGVYEVTLSVEDERGLEGIAHQRIVVADIPDGCDRIVTTDADADLALAEAATNDHVCFEEGDHESNGVVDTPGLELVSAPGSEANLIVPADSYVFNITAPDVTIKNITFEGSDRSQGSAVIAHGADELTVSETTVLGRNFDRTVDGINATESDDVTISNSTFEEVVSPVTIDGGDRLTVEESDFDGVVTAISVTDGEVVTVESSAFADGGDVLVAEGTSSVTAVANSVMSFGIGFVVDDGQDAELRENVFTDSGPAGFGDRPAIGISNWTNAHVEDTVMTGPQDGLIIENAEDVTATNITAETEDDAVTVDSSSDVEIQTITVSSEEETGIRIEESTDVDIGRAETTANFAGLRIQDSATVTAENVTAFESSTGIAIRETFGSDVAVEAVSIDGAEIFETDEALRVRGDVEATLNDSAIYNNQEGVATTGLGGLDEILDARDNWWGLEDGPSGGVEDPVNGAIADGGGDAIVENVQFDPVLENSPVDIGRPIVTLGQTNTPISEGETLTVDAVLQNFGDETVDDTVTLENFDGEVVDDAPVSADPGETNTTTLEWETERGDADAFGDTLTVEIENSTDRQEVVIEEFSPATFEVDIDETNSPVDVGETLTANATITNTGDEAGTQNIIADIPEIGSDESEVTLDADAETTASFEIPTEDDDDGEYTLTVESENETATAAVTIVPGDAGGPIDSCGPVTFAGEYHLTDDLANDETCLSVTGDDIHIDGNGYSITGQGTDEGIAVTGDNVTLTNVTTENWDIGIEFNGVKGGTIADVSSIDNEDAGVWMEDGANNTVTNSTLAGDKQNYGVHVFDTPGTAVTESVLADNSWYGIYVFNESTGSHIHGNTITENGFAGIFTDEGVATTITANSLTDNLRGMEIFGTGTLGDNVVTAETDAVQISGEATATTDTIGETTVSYDTQETVFTETSDPPENPDAESLDRYLGVGTVDTAEDPVTVDLAVHYDDTERTGGDDESLTLWLFDGDDWNELDSTVDTDTETVNVTLSAEGTVGLFETPADGTIEIIDYTLSATELTVGETFTVNATVENTGSTTDTLTVPLFVDGETNQTTTVTVGPEETGTTQFTLEPPLGTANVTVGDLAATDIDVVGPTVGDEPASDTTGDGLLNDVTGDGSFDIADVQALFDSLGGEILDTYAQYFDFAGVNSDRVSIFDVQALFNSLPADD